MLRYPIHPPERDGETWGAGMGTRPCKCVGTGTGGPHRAQASVSFCFSSDLLQHVAGSLEEGVRVEFEF